MNERDDGGQAFPTSWTNYDDRNAIAPDNSIVPPGEKVELQGMSLRDYFAARAMQGIVSAYMDPGTAVNADLESIAPVAYLVADSMLKARKA